MRKLLVFFSMMVVAAFMALNLTSCGGDDDGGDEPAPAPAPTIRILADVDAADGYKVDITVEATDATSYAWDYGDGNTSTQAGTHSYTYTASGDYTISVTATGTGGTASDSKSVSIVASIEEVIAGVGDDGKTWVLTQNEASFAGKIGGGPVDNSMLIAPEMSLIPSGVMAMFGLGDEYNDEFTFYKDGKLDINIQNGLAIGGILYGSVTELIQVPSDDPGSLPLCAMTYANVTDATWALSYDDLVVTTYNEFTTKVIEDVTFTFAEDDATKVAEMKLSQGAYLGFVDLDYTGVEGIDMDNSYYILKEVTPEAMYIAIGIAGVGDVEGVPTFMLPTFMLHLTLVPK